MERMETISICSIGSVCSGHSRIAHFFKCSAIFTSLSIEKSTSVVHCIKSNPYSSRIKHHNYAIFEEQIQN